MSASIDERAVLQLAPVWVLSALTGTSSYFTPTDRAVFRDVVAEVVHRTPRPTREVLESVLVAGEDLFLDFELDDRSVVTGLRDAVAVLDRSGPEEAAQHKLALLRIGVGIARARGPYGRVVTAESEQQLQLLAELLDLRSSTDGARAG